MEGRVIVRGGEMSKTIIGVGGGSILEFQNGTISKARMAETTEQYGKMFEQSCEEVNVAFAWL